MGSDSYRPFVSLGCGPTYVIEGGRPRSEPVSAAAADAHTSESHMKAARQVPGWFTLWSALSFVGTPVVLFLAATRAFSFGSGPIVAPLPELITNVAMAFVLFAPTVYWLGRLAVVLVRRISKV
jgi:hypothetical protein